MNDEVVTETKQQKPKKKDDEKFFFNINIFDEPDETEIAPPSYNETQLETAKKVAYKDGRTSATEETKAQEKSSRDALIQQALQQLSADTSSLFRQEEERQRMFQNETLQLIHIIFEKLFPYLKDNHGLNELKEAISQTLKKQTLSKNIIVTVSPHNEDGIRTHLNNENIFNTPDAFTVQKDKELDDTTCRIQWENGGAHFNLDEKAEAIKDIIKDLYTKNSTHCENKEDSEETITSEKHLLTDEQALQSQQLKSDKTPDTINEITGDDHE